MTYWWGSRPLHSGMGNARERVMSSETRGSLAGEHGLMLVRSLVITIIFSGSRSVETTWYAVAFRGNSTQKLRALYALSNDLAPCTLEFLLPGSW